MEHAHLKSQVCITKLSLNELAVPKAQGFFTGPPSFEVTHAGGVYFGFGPIACLVERELP